MVRAPVPGRVKTRLGAAIGPEAACRLYRAMVEDLLAHLRPAGLAIHLFHDQEEAGGLPRAWQTAAARVRPQRGVDLGARMAASFEDCFAAGLDQVVLIGSDIPELDQGHIRRAVAGLHTHQAALAPTHDGGYCLLGLTRRSWRAELFADIPWSSDRVCALTLQRFAACGLSPCLLPCLRDIDTIEDLRAYRQEPCAGALHFNRALTRVLGEAG